MIRRGSILYRKKSYKVKISDEKGNHLYSNWPKPFGAGVYKSGPKEGYPIEEDSRQIASNRNKGRVTTFRTVHRWPRPTEVMPLRKKLPEDSKYEDAYQTFANQSDPIAFPKPGEAKPKAPFQVSESIEFFNFFLLPMKRKINV